MLAVQTSNVDPLPHQITAVYESMLPRQPLRFLLADDPGAGKTIMAGLLISSACSLSFLLGCRQDTRWIVMRATGFFQSRSRSKSPTPTMPLLMTITPSPLPAVPPVPGPLHSG